MAGSRVSPHFPYREDRMVWAWDVVNGGLVRMGQGMADRLRSRCRSGDLVCPIADCPSPTFTTVRGHVRWRGERRSVIADGFRHLRKPNPSHNPESMLHVNGKLRLVDWLHEAGFADVLVERRDTQSGRTPDVTVRTGERLVAFEVQFAALSVDEWRARDSALRDAGFDVVWVWGYWPGRIDDQGIARLSAAQAEVLQNHQRLWWIDPDTEQIGLAVAHRWGRRHVPASQVTPEPGDRRIEPRWVPLSEARLHGSDLWHPQLEELDAALDGLRRLTLWQVADVVRRYSYGLVRDTERGQQWSDRRAEDSTGHRPSQSSEMHEGLSESEVPATATPLFDLDGQGLAVVGRSPPTPPPGPHHARRPQQWDPAPAWNPPAERVSPLTAQQRARLFAAGLDGVVDGTLPLDQHIYLPSSEWHGQVVFRLLDRPKGKVVNLDAIVAFVCREFAHNARYPGLVRRAVVDLLRDLADEGAINLTHRRIQVLTSLQVAGAEDAGEASAGSDYGI